MSRAAWGWLFALLILLLGSYFAWTHEKARGTAGTPVVILDLKADQIDRVAFRTEKREIVIEAATDANGRYHQVVLTETVAPKADDAAKPDLKQAGEVKDEKPAEKTPDGAMPVPEVPKLPDAPDAVTPDAPKVAPATSTKKTRRFAGGRSAERLIDRLAPLTALRVLEDVPAERLTKLGLDPAEATFEVTRGERTWVFGVGGKNFGGSRRYLHEVDTDRVYLVEATALRNLEGAERQLLERSPLGLKRGDLTATTATSGARTQRLVQKNRADRRASYWAFAAKPEEKSSVASGFIDKLFRLRVDTYVETLPATAEKACEFVVETEEGQVTVSLHRVVGPDGEPEIYAISSYLRLPVKVYQQSGVEVIDDIGSLFSE